METVNAEPRLQSHPQADKKRVNRAPSPARPFLRDSHPRGPAAKPSVLPPKSPSSNARAQSAGGPGTHSRLSRRSAPGPKDKPSPVKAGSAKASLSTKRVSRPAHGPGEPGYKGSSSRRELHAPPSPQPAAGASRRRGPRLDSPGQGVCSSLVRVSHTDSSSDLSDCPSEPLSDEHRPLPEHSSDNESGSSERVAAVPVIVLNSGAERQHGAPPSDGHREPGSSACKSPSAQSKGQEEDLLREVDELRSENDYLKGISTKCLGQVGTCMPEMADSDTAVSTNRVCMGKEFGYFRKFGNPNKVSRVKQYPLRRPDQHSLSARKTRRVNIESYGIQRSFPKILRICREVARSQFKIHRTQGPLQPIVTLLLLDGRRVKDAAENSVFRYDAVDESMRVSMLRHWVEQEQVVPLEHQKQSTLKRRGSREMHKDKKISGQEDSADLKCQLQFAKEEAVLMRKKMAKLGKEKDDLDQELEKYKSIYGDVDSPLPTGETGGPPSTREAELKLRLKLVEEEANILGRKIVELEVENRGIKAEMEDLRCQYEKEFLSREYVSSIPTSPYGDSMESATELRRHLQFVEEEAELLRRSISEIEDHNKQLTTELNRFKFGPDQDLVWIDDSASKCNGSVQEELKTARTQINELSGKVMKLQYENRVLLSNVQRYDLVSHLGMRTASPRDSDAESDTGKKESDSDDGRFTQPKREGPVGGESDSEEAYEKTSGFESVKPSEIGDLYSVKTKEDTHLFLNIRREAERLERALDRLITDTDGLIGETKVQMSTCSIGEAIKSCPERECYTETDILDSINTKMKVFKKELHNFVEIVDHTRNSLNEHGEDLSPMPNLTESSSFLSNLTSVSRDSPIGNPGKDLTADFQSKLREQMEWQHGNDLEEDSHRVLVNHESHRRADGDIKHYWPRDKGCFSLELSNHVPTEKSSTLRELQAILEQERRLHQEECEKVTDRIIQLEEEHLKNLRRKDLEVQSLTLQNKLEEKTWGQEKSLLDQEVRNFKQNVFVLYVKLKWLLAQWRQCKRVEQEEVGDKLLQIDQLPALPEFAVHTEFRASDPDMEEAEDTDEDAVFALPDYTQHSTAENISPQLQTAELLQHQKQAGENRRLLDAFKGLLDDFRSELHDEEREKHEIQQYYAEEKASWKVTETEFKCRLEQYEEKRQKVQGETSPSESKSSFKREREEHKKLLAESHSLVMDLRRQIQQTEKNWCREKGDLMDRFDRERRDWERQYMEFQRKIDMLQKEVGSRRTEAFIGDEKDGALSHFPSNGNLHMTHALGARSFSESDDVQFEEEELLPKLKGTDRCSGSENLFLDALSLDSSDEVDIVQPHKLERDKLSEGEMQKGGLQRVMSVSSMSEFHRLMESSPFLPEKNLDCVSDKDELTPPLSPDDLKYIEEFNKNWDYSNISNIGLGDKMGGASGAGVGNGNTEKELSTETFQAPSWFLTTSVTMTTNTLTNPEHCPKQSPRSHIVAERVGIRVFHSPPVVRRFDKSVLSNEENSHIDSDLLFSVTKAKGNVSEARGGPTEVFGRWPCELNKHQKDFMDSGLNLIDRPVCTTVGFASSLHNLELSRNMSDDMKEVANSVRNAIRTNPADSQFKDIACQTNGLRNTGTQTTQTISVGLQTEALRSITSSPHKCLTPKGGSTPISSPSRSIRSRQMAPAIEKVQAKFERSCCSPKYGSPKLQKKILPKTDQPNNRATLVTPQKGFSESAWARSTTTRESPVHTTINDGLSSLFNIIDHSPIHCDHLQKLSRPNNRSRSAEPRSEFGNMPEMYMDGRGRSPSPIRVLIDLHREHADVNAGRPDLSTPPGYSLTENAARVLSKKLLEEQRQTPNSPSRVCRDHTAAEIIKIEPGSIENQTILLTAPWGL
ncbi:microtubule cross-linking factor 1 [Pelobates cultripes]|uniref:Microtubule cross-linking factor 1 n=1 Tax=Pelobates cultripes TaxID=61616 RepID=A0AAD1RZQ3_PELCU|nr:microtubule cross-linking factor 1 [Pelobates cultripes]